MDMSSHLIKTFYSTTDTDKQSTSFLSISAIQPRGTINTTWCLAAATMLAITVTTVVGNAAVMAALRRAVRAPAHYPLASLAAADLLVGTAVLPIAAARELLVFELHWIVCAWWSTVDVLCCTASILSLCALGWERYSGITAPLARAKRARMAKLLAALVWPTSAAVALPAALIPAHAHAVEGDLAAKACTVNNNVGYVFFSTSFSFYMPASIMVVFYTKILMTLASPPTIRAHRGRTPTAESGQVNILSKAAAKSSNAVNKIANLDLTNNNSTTLYTSPGGLHLGVPMQPAHPVPTSPYKSLDSPGGIIPRQRRATRTIIRLMSLFLLCWTPFFIMLPVDSVCACVPDTAWWWCTWLGYANSALDPLVYAVASPSVRRALHETLTFTSRG